MNEMAFEKLRFYKVKYINIDKGSDSDKKFKLIKSSHSA